MLRGLLRSLRGRRAALAALAVLAGAAPAAAAPDETDYVLQFLRGGWRSPLLCTFDGRTLPGVRRVVIAPGPPQSERRVNRVTFSGLEAREAERCRNPLGGDAPNLVGSVLVGYTPRRRHSDTPRRDFQQRLEEGMLDLEVVAGRLRIGPTHLAPEALPEVDFAGGRAQVRTVEPGSDVARVLADFGRRRRLFLALEAPDGTRIELPLVQFELR